VSASTTHAGALDLETGRAGWLVFVTGIAVAVIPASDWRVPDYLGIPYPLAFAIAGAVALGLLVAARWRMAGRPDVGPLEALATLTGVAALLGVLTLLPTQPLRDLGVYLRAGAAFAAGAPVYLDHLLLAIPVDRTEYPFLYPPVLLPVFAALSAAPRLAVDVFWVAGSLAALVLALRAFGLPWRWVIVALAWRPISEGLWVGNVAVPLLSCLALALRYPSLLVLPPVFKAYSATAAIWLIRERHWRALAIGLAAVGLAVAATLPFTGIDLWRSWIAGLEWFARSQPGQPTHLYGIALPRFIGAGPALVVGVAVLVGALLIGGRGGLARLGLATPVLAQSVFMHGLLVTIPAIGVLRPAILWLALASMAFGGSAGAWLGPGLAVASWMLPVLRRSAAELARPHIPDPLGGAIAPWPVPAGAPPTGP
jgi:hypothetical protein